MKCLAGTQNADCDVQKLEQIDKENFGLKLKIHFLEEQMKKTGKDFNATALKENTELKVDKITLQTELKKNRKALDRAQVELEEYKKQFLSLIHI